MQDYFFKGRGILKMAIPEFTDKYHLPAGEHTCTLEEAKTKFALSTDMRRQVWECFESLINRLRHLNIMPSIILIDGSFVTGRELPEDVDFACLIEPDKIRAALNSGMNEHDKRGIQLLLNPINQCAVREMFGAHALVVDNQAGLDYWSKFFRCGGANGLRDIDPIRDPKWVIKPNEKGILRIIV